MTVKRWILVALGAIIVAGFAILGWWIYKIYPYQELYYECLSAPADSVIVWKDRVIFSDDTIKPEPRKSWTRVIRDTLYDTIIIEKEIKVNYYADSYRKDGVRIRWEATTKGTLESIQFPNIIIPERIITMEKKVPVHDTIRTNVERSHVGIYAKLFGNNVKTFPGIELGGIYSFRGRGGILGGAMYNPYHQEVYITIGGFLNLN